MCEQVQCGERWQGIVGTVVENSKVRRKSICEKGGDGKVRPDVGVGTSGERKVRAEVVMRVWLLLGHSTRTGFN